MKSILVVFVCGTQLKVSFYLIGVRIAPAWEYMVSVLVCLVSNSLLVVQGKT